MPFACGGGVGCAPHVTNERWRSTSVHAIESGLRQRLGEDVRVAVRQVDQIAPEASGKHRYVVSHVRLDGQLGLATSTPQQVN